MQVDPLCLLVVIIEGRQIDGVTLSGLNSTRSISVVDTLYSIISPFKHNVSFE